MLKLNQNWKRNQNLMNQIQEFCQNCLIMMFALWQLLSVTQDWIMTSLSSLNSLNSSSFTMMLTLILYKYVSVCRIILCFMFYHRCFYDKEMGFNWFEMEHWMLLNVLLLAAVSGWSLKIYKKGLVSDLYWLKLRFCWHSINPCSFTRMDRLLFALE